MKLKLTPVLLLLLVLPLSLQAQKRNTDDSTTKYYFDIVRPDCCALSDKQWQKIAATLKTSGIPTFFGLYDVLNYKEDWRPVKLRQTPPGEGWLILGPFDSERAALRTLTRLPKLLPNHLGNGDERVKGVEPDPFGYPKHWVIGLYQIGGFKTSLAVEAQKTKVLRPQRGMALEGTIIERNESPNWPSIVVESGGVKYGVSLRGLTQSGDVWTIGNRVKVSYKSKSAERDGTYSLDATRIDQIRLTSSAASQSNRTQTSQGISREQTWNERRTAKEIIIDLSADILFDFNKSTIRPDAIPTLQKLALLIKESGSGIVQLNGHTDSIASDEYNMVLSEQRAASVKQWLSSKGGIDAKRLQTKGYGESQPVAPNTNPDGSDNPEGRQRNRRVEIRIPRN
jgi:outer membrane protein OmpA-like peptidoglycan-associated protein